MERQQKVPPRSAFQKPLLLLVLLSNSCGCSGLSWSLRKLPCKISINQSQVFDCSNRKISNIPKGIGWNATDLTLSGNLIEKISAASFWNLRNLEFLDLGFNRPKSPKQPLKIKKDTFSGMRKLRELHLNGNSLATVPGGLPSGLQFLNLNSNLITRVKPGDFKDTPNITVLHLASNCYLGSCGTKSLKIKNKSLVHLRYLMNLTLSFNRLKAIPRFLPLSLLSLKLKLNTIDRIHAGDLRNLVNLKLLDLSGNCPVCANTPFFCQPCKTPNGELQIHPNAFAPLTHLEELRLSGNSLRSVQPSWFQNLTHLQYLYLAFNFLIGDIATGYFLAMLPRVEVMDLSYNTDESYSHNLHLSKNFSKLTSLKTLHLESYVFFHLCENDLEPLYSLTNLSVLNLATNFLQRANLTLFNKFHNLTVVDLSENRLSFQSQSADTLSACESGCKSNSCTVRRRFHPYIHKDQLYRRLPPTIKPECSAYGPVLDLSRNNIISIDPEVLQGLENTACLNLSFNFIGDMFNGSQFLHFPRLKYLDISYNKLYMRYRDAFSELPELEVLDLTGNAHYFLMSGLNHSLNFLDLLPSLKTLNLSLNEISTLTDKQISSNSLQELNFRANRLHIMWKRKDYYNLFQNLTNLTTLDLSLNKLSHIPKKVYYNLPKTLRRLSLSGNGLKAFKWNMVQQQPYLEELDLSLNYLEFVAENLSNSSLRRLDLSHNQISQLAPGFLKQARSLWDLDLSSNLLQLINQTTFEWDSENYLGRLSLYNNPWRCTCDLLYFHLWMKDNDVELPLLATGVICHLPQEMRGKSVLTYDIQACVSDDKAMAIFIVTSFHIVLLLFASVTARLFYWDLAYVLEYVLAKLKHRRPPSTGYAYDAFVMYDTKDPLASDWVLNRLRVELEERGERVRPLCLEERDWQPGAPVLENLSASVQKSRKTVLVITEGFLAHGVVRMAALLVQQRLVEEGVDALVLVLLQPGVLRRSRILHLRRRLCQRSVLEWPRPAHPAAQRWFWHRLRRVIHQDRRANHAQLHGTYFTGR
ncbi:toll-like receptor 8b [Hypomesus transpacificus]|uniref:toll-like receptor 8b n=1 Tax=Hypomesus transpacificus TaxID=137520 RepID=UPI001F07854D|nr:toll-like receptor 8b [Hypomesus transpacificus]